jgi:hypothetical protein
MDVIKINRDYKDRSNFNITLNIKIDDVTDIGNALYQKQKEDSQYKALYAEWKVLKEMVDYGRSGSAVDKLYQDLLMEQQEQM